jgi:ketosteroid isomerase-like protein
MKKILLLCLFPILALASSCNAQSPDDVRDVATAVEKLRAAMMSAKAADLNAIAADNLLYRHSSGTLETKAQFIDTIVSGRSVFVTIDLTDQQIKVTGDTAIVCHTFNAKTNDNGKPGSVKIGIMLVWQKQKGEWRLLGRQAFRM